MESPYANVVGEVRQVLEHHPVPQGNGDPEIEDLLNLVRLGRCSTCQSPLGEQTIALVSQHGVMAAYCCGPCAQDQVVLGWLQEQFEDIQSSVVFRSGTGDTAQEEA